MRTSGMPSAARSRPPRLRSPGGANHGCVKYVKSASGSPMVLSSQSSTDGEPRFGGMAQQIVEAVVAVNDGRARLFRNRAFEPRDQFVHFRQLFGFGLAILARPARHLPREVVAGRAEVARARRQRGLPRAAPRACRCTNARGSAARPVRDRASTGSVRACPGTWLITKNDVPMTSGSSHST